MRELLESLKVLQEFLAIMIVLDMQLESLLSLEGLLGPFLGLEGWLGGPWLLEIRLDLEGLESSLGFECLFRPLPELEDSLGRHGIVSTVDVRVPSEPVEQNVS